MANTAPSAVRVYKRALNEARPFWPHLGALLLIGLLFTPMSLLNPLPLKIIVDCVLGQQPLPWSFFPGHSAFTVAITVVIVLAILNLALRLGEWLCREWVGERMAAAFRIRLFERTLQSTPPGQDACRIQDVAYRIANDAGALPGTALHGIIPVIVALVAVCGTLWVTMMISPTLAAIALATTVPAIMLVHLQQKHIRRRWHSAREEESRTQSIMQEVFSDLRRRGATGERHDELHRYSGACTSTVRARLRAIRRQGLLGTALSLSTAFGSVTILWIGVTQVQTGLLTVGDLVIIIAYVAQLYEPLQQIGTHIASQQQVIASAERAFDILDRPILQPQAETRLDGVRLTDRTRKPALRVAA